ncbi:hypothetical protein [Allokutzneria oryzae]|uniref:DUF4386 family protein n=1 Tax=Allokutzneria oryzae TaxID=1378989 RepID=A0ABV5ZWJ8_9PSEU
MSFHGAADAGPSAPSAMRAAFALVAASVVCTVLGLVLTFAYRDEILRAAVEPVADIASGILSQDTVLRVAGPEFDDHLLSAAIFQGICCALVMVLGLLAAKGGSAARVLLTIMMVLTVLAGFLGADARYPSIIVTVVMIGQILQVAALTLLWVPASTGFFQAVKAVRPAPPIEVYALRLR